MTRRFYDLLVVGTLLWISSVNAAEEPKTPAAKLPEPDAAALRAAEQTIREIFKSDFAKSASEDKLALAQKLIQQGHETGDDPTSRYALFRMAEEISIGVADATSVLKAIDALAQYFAIDPVARKSAALGKIAALARTPESNKVLAECLFTEGDQAIAQDKFLDGLHMFDLSLAAARKAQSMPLLTKIMARQKAVQELQRAYLNVASAAKVLFEKPDDPAANGTVGAFTCFRQGMWEKGLPMLAKSDDAVVRQLAESELAKPSTPAEQSTLANKWWEYAQKQSDKVKAAAIGRSVYWQQQCLPKLTGLERSKAEIRLTTTLFGAGAKIWETRAGGKDPGVSLGEEKLDVTQKMTIEFWISTRSEDGVILTKRHKEEDGSITAQLVKGAPVVGGDAREYRMEWTSKTKINDGNWHHLAIVKLNREVRLFIDGKREFQVNTLEAFTSTSPWVLGYHGTWKPSPFAAKFCKIRFSSVDRYAENFEPVYDYPADPQTLVVK